MNSKEIYYESISGYIKTSKNIISNTKSFLILFYLFNNYFKIRWYNNLYFLFNN